MNNFRIFCIIGRSPSQISTNARADLTLPAIDQEMDSGPKCFRISKTYLLAYTHSWDCRIGSFSKAVFVFRILYVVAFETTAESVFVCRHLQFSLQTSPPFQRTRCPLHTISRLPWCILETQNCFKDTTFVSHQPSLDYPRDGTIP